MHLYHDLDFDAIGYDPIVGQSMRYSYDEATNSARKRAYVVQLACEYLLDTIYADYPEECVIKGYGPNISLSTGTRTLCGYM